MRIDFNTNNQVNQNFRAVNQKYLKDAQRMFEKRGTITSEWIESLTDDVALFKEISKSSLSKILFRATSDTVYFPSSSGKWIYLFSS